MTNVARKNDGYCNNCPRDNLPRKQLSKGLLSNVTVVQADYCPRRLLSNEAFTSKKLAHIDFSFFIWTLRGGVTKKTGKFGENSQRGEGVKKTDENSQFQFGILKNL